MRTHFILFYSMRLGNYLQLRRSAVRDPLTTLHVARFICRHRVPLVSPASYFVASVNYILRRVDTLMLANGQLHSVHNYIGIYFGMISHVLSPIVSDNIVATYSADGSTSVHLCEQMSTV